MNGVFFHHQLVSKMSGLTNIGSVPHRPNRPHRPHLNSPPPLTTAGAEHDTQQILLVQRSTVAEIIIWNSSHNYKRFNTSYLSWHTFDANEPVPRFENDVPDCVSVVTLRYVPGPGLSSCSDRPVRANSILHKALCPITFSGGSSQNTFGAGRAPERRVGGIISSRWKNWGVDKKWGDKAPSGPGLEPPLITLLWTVCRCRLNWQLITT